MKNRIDLVWRVAVVTLLLVLAVAPAVLLGGSMAALEPGDPPDTYLDPIPAFIDARFADDTPWITGTSIAAPYRTVDNVWVQVINNSNGYRWDDTIPGWVNDVNLWNPATVAAVSWGQNQWDWEYPGVGTPPASTDLYRGVSYTIKVRAEDDDGYLDLSPEQDTFTYDNWLPDVSFTTVFNLIMYQNDITGINGAAHDDHSGIAQVRMQVIRSSGEYWNGYSWVAGPIAGWWIPVKTSGTGKDVTWSIDQNSVPPLPQWDNMETYAIIIQAQDKAGNVMMDVRTFTYRHKLASAGVYMDPLPQYAGPGTYFLSNSIITGTAKAEHPLLQNIVTVRLKIYDETDSVYWDDTASAWTGSDPPWADCVDGSPSLVLFPLDNHWDWQVTLPGGIWNHGHDYKVMVGVMDDNTPTAHTYGSDWQSFTFDIIPPGSNIDPYDADVYNRWTYLTGESSDVGSVMDAVLVLIRRVRVTVPAGYMWWDGNIWNSCRPGSAVPACAGNWWSYVLSTPQDGNFNSADEDWMINLDTVPGLPPLRNGEGYEVYVFPVDAAGNMGMPPAPMKVFTFKYDMASAHPTPVPDYYVPPTATPEATATPGVTGTPVATSTPKATATPEPTKSPAKPTATPTPKPTSVTKTIGAGGGEICLDDKVCVDFPSGAFSANTQVIVTQTACSGAPDGFRAGSTCFTISPSSALAAAAEVCVEYSSYDYSSLAGGDADRIRLAYKDGGTWNLLDTTVDTAAGTACAQTTHLSSWVLAVEEEEEGGGWQWWYWLLIGLAVLLIIGVIVLLVLRPKAGGGEGEEMEEEEGYEEEEL